MKPTTAHNRFADLDVTPNPGITSFAEFVFNLRWPGQYYNKESGLHYNYFRSYCPSCGRYTQPDPMGLAGGWNGFGYVDADPLQFTDPLGLANSGAVKCMAPPPSSCFDYEKFADYIRENRLDLDIVLATLGADLAFGTMPKTPSELRGLGVPRSQLNPYTSQLSRWSNRVGDRVLRELGRTSAGMAAGAAATGSVVFEGFYDWTIIAQALAHASSPENCICKR